MQPPEQLKWDIFERCVKKDTVNGKDKSRTGNVEHFGSPAECVSHFLNLLRGHKHSKSCKCENTWEIEGDKLVFKKVCRKKLQAIMKSKLGLKEDQEVPPHLVRTQKTPHVFDGVASSRWRGVASSSLTHDCAAAQIVQNL